MRTTVLAGLMIALASTAGTVRAQSVPQNVGHRHHPNLAKAQQLLEKADQRIIAAQQANEFDLGGHAAKAKELIEQADHELKEAAEAANENRHHER
jgi:hypothetical protein